MIKSSTDVKYLKGVGPKRSEILLRLGINNLRDLIFYFPRSYRDYRTQKEFDELIEAVNSVFGEVIDYYEQYTSTSLRIFKIIIKTADGRMVEVNVFKKASLRFDVFASIKKKIGRGKKIFVVARSSDIFFPNRLDADEIFFECDADFNLTVERIVPVYSLTSGIDNRTFRMMMRRCLDLKTEIEREILPRSIINKRGLYDRYTALEMIHFPSGLFELKKARERFIYEELFLMAVAWALKKKQSLEIKKPQRYEVKRTLLTPFKNRLGFEFTPSQKKAINEIFSDMMSPNPMNRLLQGDVGSGKTVVALCACLLAAENGHQSCFIAPTEILAEQHYYTFKKFLQGLDVRVELLTSSTPKKKRKQIYEQLLLGEIDIIVATHSVLEGEVRFKDLTLAVIDEQHRFGVRQRATVRKKGESVDMLVMTATPIPRTLFLALYGDLDLSTLTDMPPGRKKVFTAHVSESEAFEKAKKLLNDGDSVYIVFPVIEESKDPDVRSLIKEYERIKREFSGFNTALLHGGMKSLEKQKIMRDFYERKIQILCSTTVIEVGIDVPHANIMIIENAERFGLASLHQLRGRIGRGSRYGYCFLVSSVKSADGYERIKAMCETSNGFELSEKDAYIRGVGEVLGTRQHGDMELKIACVYRDRAVLSNVFEDRDEIIRDDPYLLKPQHSELRKELIEIYGKKWNIIDLN
ncbi:MAG: ATP-dependent DNA helicase RecG [Elusimicrobiales bacterium]